MRYVSPEGRLVSPEAAFAITPQGLMWDRIRESIGGGRFWYRRRTVSEPTPTSLKSRFTRAAPLQFIVGGDVKIACSSRYSQLPVNGRVETTYASVTSSMPA